ncbi:MAG: family 78 glycoside hydrolase catalytic domain [Promethearchaeota archaeon]
MNSIIVYDLRVEYLKNPMGIDIKKPLFSWKMKIEAENEAKYNLIQSGFRIIVDSNKDNIENDIGNVWDSGKIESNNNFAQEYNGKELESNKKYFWKVKVWLKSGQKEEGQEIETDWSEIAYWTTGFFTKKEFRGKWIGPKVSIKRKIEHILNSYSKSPATYLRRSFEIDGKIIRATLYSTALGIYKIFMNGECVSNRYFAPEWTDYRKKVFYQVYDVTNKIKSGINVIGAILADGWYSGRLGLLINRFYGAERCFKAFMIIELQDGTSIRKKIIETDSGWEYTEEGPIRAANFLDGEEYDSRMELKNWNTNNYEPNNCNIKWKRARIFNSLKLKKLKLVAQKNEPVIAINEVIPKDTSDIKEIEPSKYIINIGQNIAGFIRIKITPEICNANTEITLRHAEILDENGRLYTKNLRSAKATDKVFYDGREILEYQPYFTFHGFQFVEISGLKPNIDPEKFIKDKIVVGIAVSSGAEISGQIKTSHKKLNKLMENIYWTQRNNQISIPTDCPQRDERLGWMGDAHIFAQTAMYNLNMAAFFKKWIEDIRDSQLKKGVYPDVVPHTPRLMVKFLVSSPAWADCGVNLPLFHYKNYGDLRVLKEHYSSAKKFVDYILKKNQDFIWKKSSGRNYGDWLNGDTVKFEGYPKKGGEIPKDVFATLFFGRMVENLAKIAKIIGKNDDAQLYFEFASKIKQSFRDNFMNENCIIKGDTQSGYALALDFGFIPEKMVEKTRENLIKALERYDYRLSTGFLGTLSLMNQLIQMNRPDLAYNLLFSERFPSWFYMINNGATTIWERWDSYVPKRGMQSASMTSFDHYAFGSIGEWIYKNLLGLNLSEEGIGFQKIIFKPIFTDKIDFVEGRFKSISGDYEFKWKKLQNEENDSSDDSGFNYLINCKIPINTQATIMLPIKSLNEIKINGKLIDEEKAVINYKIPDNSTKQKMIMISVGSGIYEIKI